MKYRILELDGWFFPQYEQIGFYGTPRWGFLEETVWDAHGTPHRVAVRRNTLENAKEWLRLDENPKTHPYP